MLKPFGYYENEGFGFSFPGYYQDEQELVSAGKLIVLYDAKDVDEELELLKTKFALMSNLRETWRRHAMELEKQLNANRAAPNRV